MLLRRVHLWAGTITVVAFLISGQFMRHHNPPMDALPIAVRMVFRSRHIYILASGLVNLMLGIYVQPVKGRRRAIQRIGSGLLLVSPVLLTSGFAVETAAGAHPGAMWSQFGLYSLFGGSILHVAASAGRRSAG